MLQEMNISSEWKWRALEYKLRIKNLSNYEYLPQIRAFVIICGVLVDWEEIFLQ